MVMKRSQLQRLYGEDSKSPSQNYFVRVVCRWKTCVVIAHVLVVHCPPWSSSNRSVRHLTIKCQTSALSNPTRPSWHAQLRAVIKGTYRQAHRLTWYTWFQHHCWIKDRHSKGVEFWEVTVFKMLKVGSVQKYLRAFHLLSAFSP